MRKFWVVAKETYKKNISSGGFLLTLLAPILFLALIIGIGYYMGYFDQEDPTTEVADLALMTEDETLEQSLTSDPDFFPHVNFLLDFDQADQAKEAMVQGQIDGYLELAMDQGQLTGRLVHQGDIPLQALEVQQVLNQFQLQLKASQMGISEDQLQDLTGPAELEVEEVELVGGDVQGSDEANQDQFTKQVVAYFISILILVFILSYSSIMAEEIATEKGSRMMEIILSAVSPSQHFMGKLVGVFLLFLTQILLYTGLTIFFVYIFQDSSFINTLTQNIDFDLIFNELIGYALIYFFTGMLTYLVTAAFLGSLVTREENISKSVTPLAFVAAIGFFIANTALADPTTTLVQVSSYFPYFTPFVMPFRIAAGAVSDRAISISIIVSLVFSILMTLLALVFYASNVLVYSDTNLWDFLKRSWTISSSNRRAAKEREMN